MRVDGPAADFPRGVLESLAAVLEHFSLPAWAGDAEAERALLQRSIREHLLPKLRHPEAPMIIALVGQSGSGKSTLLNSLAQERVSLESTLRPTTRTPVAWPDPQRPDHLVERLRALTGARVVDGDHPLTSAAVVVDTPPFDLDSEDGEVVQQDLLGLADACVFVASGLRYADAAGWDLLRRARDRGLPVVFVLNRLPPTPEVQGMLIEDFAARLAANGFLPRTDASQVVAITEQAVMGEIGGLAALEVAGLRKEVEALSDREARSQVMAQSVRGALDQVVGRAGRLREAVEFVARARRRLLEAVEHAYAEEAEAFGALLASGGLAELAAVEDREQCAADLAAIVTRAASSAARRAAAVWEADPVGAGRLRQNQGLWGHGPGTIGFARRLFDAWDGSLGGLTAQRLSRRWVWRRTLDRLGEALRRLVLDPSGPLPSRLVRRLGDDGVARLIEGASQLLAERVQSVLDFDASRFGTSIGETGVTEGLGPELGEAIDGISALTNGMQRA